MSAPATLESSLRSIVRDVVREELRAALSERGERNTRGLDGNENGYLSIARAAKFADVAPGTLRRWIRTGRLPVRRAGRVYRIGRAELEDFLARDGRRTDVAAKARAIIGRTD